MRIVAPPYRGRIAPSPTGYLHLGHAQTFWTAYQRAIRAEGTLVFRNEDLDPQRCRPEFVAAMFEDLRWLGIQWQEGPDCGGPFSPYTQSERRLMHLEAFEKLRETSRVYPCACTRQEIRQAAPSGIEGEEPIYPGKCRPRSFFGSDPAGPRSSSSSGKCFAPAAEPKRSLRCNWRFQVEDGRRIAFVDGRFGPQSFLAGKDFGDFVVWRNNDVPAYQLAVVVDDQAMKITEVVRGADLLVSTARQLLLYEALGLAPPQFYHGPLVTDDRGVRLAKRFDSLSLRELRRRGAVPASLIETFH